MRQRNIDTHTNTDTIGIIAHNVRGVCVHIKWGVYDPAAQTTTTTTTASALLIILKPKPRTDKHDAGRIAQCASCGFCVCVGEVKRGWRMVNVSVRSLFRATPFDFSIGRKWFMGDGIDGLPCLWFSPEICCCCVCYSGFYYLCSHKQKHRIPNTHSHKCVAAAATLSFHYTHCADMIHTHAQRGKGKRKPSAPMVLWL